MFFWSAAQRISLALAVIALLWTGDLQAADRLFPMPHGPTTLPAELQSLSNLPLMTRLIVALAGVSIPHNGCGHVPYPKSVRC